MLHEDVFIAEAPVADVTLVGLLSHVGQADVTNEPVLVAEVLVAQ